jgi:hypothetical protein
MATIDLQSILDAQFQIEYERRKKIERNFAWATSLVREYAVWESENGRSRKITEWHARQIAERLCDVMGLAREDFARMVIADSKGSRR